MGLAEVRRPAEQYMIIDNQIGCYFNGQGFTGGTGFLINNVNDKKIVCFKSYSHRISKLIWKLSKNVGRIKLIQVYAPTTAAMEEEIEDFYEHLQVAINEDTCKYTIIMGDMNAKVGKTKTNNEKCAGRYGIGERNERGERLIEFAEGNNLFILNTFYQKDDSRKWTWISPDGQTKNEIDYFISNNRRIIQDVDTENEVNVGSDHRPIKVILKLCEENKQNYHRQKKMRYSYDELRRNDFENKLNTNLNRIQINKEMEINNYTKQLTQGMIKIREETKKGDQPKSKIGIPKELKKLMEKRRRIKRMGKGKIEFSEISKLIRKMWKELSNNKKIEEIRNTILSGRSIKTCIRQQQIGINNIIVMKNKHGEEKRETKEIARIIGTFYRDLYNADDNEKDDAEVEEEKYKDNMINWSITEKEVENIVKNLKEGKTSGLDDINNEEIKAGGGTLAKMLCVLFNQCLKQGEIPLEWLKGKLVLLFKKGDRKDIKNYRPINLLSALYKVLMAIISKRIDSHLTLATPPNQTGFKTNYSTLDNILVLQELINKSNIYNYPLVLLFIDFEKAFDRVTTHAILKTLENLAIDKIYLKLFKYIYTHAKLTFNLKNISEEIEVKRGLRQGDIPSAKIFNAVLETAFNKLNWDNKGININGEWLNCLKFADDVVLIGKSSDEINEMLKDLIIETNHIGLNININKTKIMYVNCSETNDITINQSKIEITESFIYLGQRIEKDGQWKEILRRISLGWSTFNKYKHIFTSGVEIENKKKLFNMCVLPVILYGCETWRLTEKSMRKIRTSVRTMTRIMLGITRRDKKTRQWIREKSRLKDIGKIIMERKWNWSGHIVRTKDDRWTKKIINWYPWELKRNRGRPQHTWDQEFRKTCGGATWQRVAMDRREWQRMKEVYLRVWLYEE